MNIREQILSTPETLSDLTWAAEQRFRDGEELQAAARYGGSVYMCGLAAEMWLKVACFKFLGATPNSTVDSLLGPAKVWMKISAPLVKPESYHSLLFWVEYLMRQGTSRGTALPVMLAGQLRHHVVHRLFIGWKIDLRYRVVAITERDTRRVYNDTVWVRRTWDQLWK